MREIKKGDTTFKVRGLTRAEVKQLRKDGFDLAGLTAENAEAAMDQVFETVFTDHEIRIINELVYHDALDVFTVVMAETYGSKDEEKNLPASGPGTQTESG